MRRHHLGSVAVTSAAILSLTVAGQAATKTWDGGAGTANWGDANNWDSDGVPTANVDNVTIGAPGDAINNTTVNLGGTTRQVRGVNVTLNGVKIQPGAAAAFLQADFNTVFNATNVTFESASGTINTGITQNNDLGNTTLTNVVAATDMKATWRIRGLGASARTLAITGGEINNGNSWTIAEDGSVAIDGSNANRNHRTGAILVGSASGYTTGTANLSVTNAYQLYVSNSGGIKAGQYQNAALTFEDTTVRAPHFVLYDKATLAVTGATVYFQPQSNASSTTGRFDVQTTSAAAFDGEGLTVWAAPSANMTGTYEVSGRDLGAVLAGFTNNYSLDELKVGEFGRSNSVSTLQLIDAYDNNSIGAGRAAEALYVDTLRVGSDITLDLGGFHLYYKTLINDNGSGGQYMLNVLNGSLTGVAIPEPSAMGLLGLGSLVLARRHRNSQ